MICPRCGTYMDDEALTCEKCGTPLHGGARTRETGVRAMRQGRVSASAPQLHDDEREEIPEYGDYDLSPLPLQPPSPMRKKSAKNIASAYASRPTAKRGVPTHTGQRPIAMRGGHYVAKPVKAHPVNWMLVGIILAGVALLGVVGYLLYMSQTDEGQRMTAMNVVQQCNEQTLTLAASTDEQNALLREETLKTLNKAPAQAYWLVGSTYMDKGDVYSAITAYRIADLLDPENYDGLLLLANAYELAEQDAEAETLYLALVNTISPSRTEAYTALIRMYQNQDRDPEAANMMLLAYQNTDKETYRLQRKDFIPNTPMVDLAAGRYELTQEINLSSPQGYDVYYATDDAAVLPQDGTLARGPITIPEGTINLRAVCVSEDLVSDPLSVQYVIYYPSPAAPRCNLAPNTYDKPKTVSLRPGEGDEKEELVFYYTIDGSQPDETSPVYDGNPIQLPNGRVWLKAVCVNSYGKMSSTLEVFYKITASPAMQKPYSEEDVFYGFKVNGTTMSDFKKKFGEPESETATQYLALTNEAKHLQYDWGHAVFLLNGNTWQLARIEFTRNLGDNPRGLGIGASEASVIAAYRDVGQVESPNGRRGLYYDDPNIGFVEPQADGTRLVQYTTSTVDSKVWALQYHIRNGSVFKIAYFYQP